MANPPDVRSPDGAGPVPNRRNAELRHDLALILAEWDALSRDEPWHIHPRRYGLDSLHQSIRGVLDVALGDGGDQEASERLVRAASAHGDQRRTQGVGDDAVLREYHALRTAIWRYLMHAPMATTEAVTAICRVDVVISVATTAALRGYHRSDMAPIPEWEVKLLHNVATATQEIINAFGRPGRGSEQADQDSRS